MRNRTEPIVLRALALFAVLVIAAGCTPEPGTPDVVSTTPPAEQPTGSTETTPPPLADITISLEPLADGFDQPLFVTGAGDGSRRIFVLEKTGRAWILRGGERSPEPFLDLSEVVSTDSEQGLLGMAFAPGFDGEGLVYVNYTRSDGTSVLSSFEVSGDAVDSDSERVLLTVLQPYKNHNGGMIVFGPDGHLYFGLGDGGSGGDPQGNGQNTQALLGKILRLDMRQAAEAGAAPYAIPRDNPFLNRAGYAPEIWSLGLRNPWRFSFDRETGDLWIGDVGQNAWEEIDFQPASSAGGENYGWSLYEGIHTYPGGEAVAVVGMDAYTWPVVEYDRAAGTSVTGGYVYRGTAHPALRGTYLYADFSLGRIWGLRRDRQGLAETRLLLDTDMMISSFGEDDDGELYVVDFNGAVYRVTAE